MYSSAGSIHTFGTLGVRLGFVFIQPKCTALIICTVCVVLYDTNNIKLSTTIQVLLAAKLFKCIVCAILKGSISTQGNHEGEVVYIAALGPLKPLPLPPTKI